MILERVRTKAEWAGDLAMCRPLLASFGVKQTFENPLIETVIETAVIDGAPHIRGACFSRVSRNQAEVFHLLHRGWIQSPSIVEVLLACGGLRQNRHATALSARQQQRLAIARAIAMKPNVLLFDDRLPCSIRNWPAKCAAGNARSGVERMTMVCTSCLCRQIGDQLIFMDQE
jgi:hypothetical protein